MTRLMPSRRCCSWKLSNSPSGRPLNFQLCDDLRPMHVDELRNGFHFYGDLSLNYEVNSVAELDSYSFVSHGQRYLEFDHKTSPLQFVRQADLVGTFEETRAQRRVDSECAGKHFAAEIVDLHPPKNSFPAPSPSRRSATRSVSPHDSPQRTSVAPPCTSAVKQLQLYFPSSPSRAKTCR
jgi:hypothetical protein